MNEPKPIFRKENLLYEREEKNGYWTFISKIHPETRELIVNRTGKEILMLCDGSRTLQMIEYEMQNRYPNVGSNRIRMDVAKTIAIFSRLGIIEWEDENPFLYKKEEPIADDLSMLIGQEYNICSIKEFIHSLGIFRSLTASEQNYFFYESPLFNFKEYEEVALRQKLFAYAEEFFLLLQKEKIVGLISIELPVLPNNSAAIIKLIVSPQSYFCTFLKYAQDNFPVLSVKNITKIKLFELLAAPLVSEMKELLLNEGYKEEGILHNEFGFGGDVKIWAYCYERKFIEGINKMKGGDKNGML